MYKFKIILLSLLFLVTQQPQSLHANLLTDATQSCQKVWNKTKKMVSTNVPNLSSSQHDDSRILMLGTLGFATSCLGLWVIKTGIDSISKDQIKLLQNQLAQNPHILAKGIATTIFGIICTLSGIVLIVTSKPIVNAMK